MIYKHFKTQIFQKILPKRGLGHSYSTFLNWRINAKVIEVTSANNTFAGML
jgi:hypothetical protein